MLWLFGTSYSTWLYFMLLYWCNQRWTYATVYVFIPFIFQRTRAEGGLSEGFWVFISVLFVCLVSISTSINDFNENMFKRKKRYIRPFRTQILLVKFLTDNENIRLFNKEHRSNIGTPCVWTETKTCVPTSVTLCQDLIESHLHLRVFPFQWYQEHLWVSNYVGAVRLSVLVCLLEKEP